MLQRRVDSLDPRGRFQFYGSVLPDEELCATGKPAQCYPLMDQQTIGVLQFSSFTMQTLSQSLYKAESLHTWPDPRGKFIY